LILSADQYHTVFRVMYGLFTSLSSILCWYFWTGSQNGFGLHFV